ncbi:MAG: RNA polymerase sigma factor [Rhodoplanes sp.]|uniref:RNA polymerase sigma factor n=1 Tax=Rhodoplanes sp. TaxID=1968906 RepID=UPI0017D4D0D8|nr:RNA polymerase sigma factor [Rhodoplanes sp.]NVO13598.1 RNA polymerase sigma factor [Rhodoplanes sp.]
MTTALMSMLRRLLVDDYRDLKERLARRYGSSDFASEVLHEAWLRLNRVDAGPSAAALDNPRAYLYRVALNVATDRQRAEKARLTAAQLDALYRTARNDLDPARIAEARSELAALAKAIRGLPPRRRAVFTAARLEGLPYKLIAERLGVTVRVVDRDMKLALDQLSEILNKNPPSEGGSGGPEPSS